MSLLYTVFVQMRPYKYTGEIMAILLILLMFDFVSCSRLMRSRSERMYGRLGDLESEVNNNREATDARLRQLEERLTKETRYQREDLKYIQEQLDKIAASHTSDTKEHEDSGNQIIDIGHENKCSIDNDMCARVARAFPDLKRDLYDKLEETTQGVRDIAQTDRSSNGITEADLKDIQERLPRFDNKDKELLQMMDTLSDRMQSIIKRESNRCDIQIDDIKDRLVDFEKKIINFVKRKIIETVENVIKSQTSPKVSKPKSCRETTVHGAVTIYPDFKPNGLQVFCDQRTDNGGWVVFQRRQDGSVNFYRGWKDYEDGFGNVDGEFWLGNKYLHLFTKDQRGELRVDMKDFEGNSAYAYYTDFKVGPPSDKFRLNIGKYSGTAGNGLQGEMTKMSNQDGQQFSTYDNDNDQTLGSSCALTYKGASWYNLCFEANFNGEYSHGGKKALGRGIVWSPWKGFFYSLKFVEMKFRISP